MSAGAAPGAGERLPESALIDVDALCTAYFDRRPDPSLPGQRVRFGTSGHRGSSLRGTFNEWHVLAMAQAICEERRARGVDGPLFLGIDTHALSQPAYESALEVLVANDVAVRVAAGGDYTPTPAVSHAILGWNRDASAARADGIVVTPSHNPPEDGGFKYNPPHGGPAQTDLTAAIERRANAHLDNALADVRRMRFERARASAQVREHDFRRAYVDDLGAVVDFDVVRGAGLRLGVDPLGGAGVHYWGAIAERHRIDLDVVSEEIDPRFAFMTADRDGRIRMDPSSPWAMKRLLSLQERYDVAFACDTDHDRHGIVVPVAGLMPANHYLSVVAHSLFAARARWPRDAALGKTLVSTAMLDRVAAKLGRRVVETPVGFKWFVDGLLDASLGFAGEESAGASVLRRDGSVWTTDKDGIALALLAAEITARDGRDPARSYAALESELGRAYSDRLDAPADAAQRAALGALRADAVDAATLAGEPVLAVLDRAPGNDAPIGGIKVVAERGWFAARPSGTEDICKIYAESFVGEAHLREILAQARSVVDAALRKAQ